MRTRLFSICMFVILSLTPTFAQDISRKELSSKIREYRIDHEYDIIAEFIKLLSIPNHSYDSENIMKNAEFIKAMMEKRNIQTRIFDSHEKNPRNPIVFGELAARGAEKTLMFYAHYDGQRVIPSKWTDSEPFAPVIRPGKLEPGADVPKPILIPMKGERFEDDWRLYGRSTSDDKAPIAAILSALDGLRSIGVSLQSNLKFIFEGAEEEGSAHLMEFIEHHADLLEADVVFICDGPVYPTGQPTLYFGNRGIQSLTITVYGPNTNLHSGHYGNWAPNPAFKLSRLLAGMKDADGTVLIDGFYDTVEPLNPGERQALRDLPRLDEQLQNQYEFSGPEGGGKSLNELINLPSLNIRWLESGMNRTIVPHQASVLMDVRLVKGTDGRDMADKVRKHIEKQGYHIVSKDPDHETRMRYPDIVKFERGNGTPASRTSMELPVSRQVIAVLDDAFDEHLALIPSLGGTIPTYLFTDILNIPAIGIPIANPDNNQHQYDENIRIGNFWRGIETMAPLLLFVK